MTRARVNTKAGYKKLIWAFDPFRTSKGSWQHLEQFLGNLAVQGHFEIEPTFVLSPDSLNWSGDAAGPWIKKCTQLAEQHADIVLGPLRLEKKFLPLKVLSNSKPSTRKDVAILNKFAKKRKANWIITSSTHRSSLERWVLGSFAETLLFESQLPVMVLKPEEEAPNRIDRVLFPTDLLAQSRKALKKVAEICRLLGAEVVLLHKLPEPIEPIVQMGIYQAGGGWMGFEKYIEQAHKSAKSKLAKWSQELTRQGVKNSYELIDEPGLLAESILRFAQSKKIDLIAVGSEASRFSAVLLGSVARQVLRKSPLPVMVLPKACIV